MCVCIVQLTFEGIVQYVCPQIVEDDLLVSKIAPILVRGVEAAVEREAPTLPIKS